MCVTVCLSVFVCHSGSSGAQPLGAAPLQRGAGPGEGHLHVPGQQGLPVRLERVLESERCQRGWGEEPEPRGAAKGRPLQLEQQPDAPRTAVEAGGRGCEL